MLQASWHRGSAAVPAHWPSSGQVTFADYSTRYRDDLDPVLRGINISIKPGEKVRLRYTVCEFFTNYLFFYLMLYT